MLDAVVPGNRPIEGNVPRISVKRSANAGKAFANNAKGFEQLIAWLKNRHGIEVRICMEVVDSPTAENPRPTSTAPLRAPEDHPSAAIGVLTIFGGGHCEISIEEIIATLDEQIAQIEEDIRRHFDDHSDLKRRRDY